MTRQTDLIADLAIEWVRAMLNEGEWERIVQWGISHPTSDKLEYEKAKRKTEAAKQSLIEAVGKLI